MAVRILPVVALLVYAVRFCESYPVYFLYPGLTKVQPKPDSDAACSDLPGRFYGTHKAIIDDTDAAFVFTNAADGSSVSKFCPGQKYSLEVQFPNRRLALLTGSTVSFDAATDACKNRLALDPQYNRAFSKSTSNTATFTVPCSTTSDTTFQMISAVSQTDNFRSARVTVPLGSSCAPCTSSPAPTQITTPTPAAILNTTVAAQMCATPKQNGPKCSASSLGYACSSKAGDVTVHWSTGGCPPTNPCTSASTVVNSQINGSQTMLHMAVSGRTTGFVAVGFTKDGIGMPNTDAVIGWVSSSGSSFIEAFNLKEWSVSLDTVYSPTDSFLAFSGAVEQGDTTTICFTRPLDAPTAKSSKALSLAKDITMNYALGGQGVDTLRQHNKQGGLVLNLRTNTLAAADGRDYTLAHGILMAVAWVLLAPLGMTVARHKWVLKERKLGQIHVWFHAHRIVQGSAVAVFIAGFALALTKLSDPEGRIGDAHTILGYLLMALTGVQVLAAFIRPTPNSPHRRAWNLLHWNLGRLTMATAITNVYIGIALYSDKQTEKLVGWLVPVSIVLGLYLVMDIILSLRRPAQPAEQQKKPQDTAAVITANAA